MLIYICIWSNKKKKTNGSSPHFSARVAWGSTVLLYVHLSKHAVHAFVGLICNERVRRQCDAVYSTTSQSPEEDYRYNPPPRDQDALRISTRLEYPFIELSFTTTETLDSARREQTDTQRGWRMTVIFEHRCNR